MQTSLLNQRSHREKCPLSFSRQVKIKTQVVARLIICILQPAGIHLFKANNGNIKTISEICSNKNTRTSSTYFTSLSGVSIIDFEMANVCWVPPLISSRFVRIPKGFLCWIFPVKNSIFHTTITFKRQMQPTQNILFKFTHFHLEVPPLFFLPFEKDESIQKRKISRN